MCIFSFFFTDVYPNTVMGGLLRVAVSSRCTDISLSSPLETIAFGAGGGGSGS